METSTAAPDAGDAPEKLRLKVVEGNAAGTVIEVGDGLMIGRQAEGDGALGNDIEISRQHARVERQPDGRYVVEDLESTNGTFVNGRRIERPAFLDTGDRIELGASALVVQLSANALSPTPPARDTVAGRPVDPDSAAAAPGEAPEVAADAAPELTAAGPGEPTEGPELPASAPEEDALEEGEPAPVLDLHIQIDLEAGEATVALDDASEAVRFVHEDGRWQISR